jgi:hypothetical protein
MTEEKNKERKKIIRKNKLSEIYQDFVFSIFGIDKMILIE